MQVEEEEEANGESDDHATYTIEDQYASRRRQTSMPSDGPIVGRKHRRSRVRSAPQSDRGIYAREALVWDDDYYWPASSNVDGLMSRQLGSGVLSGILVKVCWI